MQEVVLTLDLHNDKKCKQKAMNRVSSIHGIDSISMNMEERKMTLTGSMDPIQVVTKLRKTYRVKVVSIGPAKEAKKTKDEDKPDTIQIINPCEYYPYYPRYYTYYY